MADRLLQTLNFKLFPERDNRCCTVYIVRKVIPNCIVLYGIVDLNSAQYVLV